MNEAYVIVGYQRGTCALCEKDDRDTLHVRCTQGTLDGHVCLKCLIQLVKLRQAAGQVTNG